MLKVLVTAMVWKFPSTINQVCTFSIIFSVKWKISLFFYIKINIFYFLQFVQHQPFKVKTLESILFVLWIQNPWLALIDGYLTVRKPLLKFQVLKVPCFSVITNLQLTKVMDKFYAGHQIILANKNLLVFFMLFLWDLLHHQKNAKYENNFFKGNFLWIYHKFFIYFL